MEWGGCLGLTEVKLGTGQISTLSLVLIPRIITSYQVRHRSSLIGLLDILSKNQILHYKITLDPNRGKRRIRNKGIN